MGRGRFAALEAVLGYSFADQRRVRAALTHSSLVNEPAGVDRDDNQRFAHLGDAVIELAVRHALFDRFPRATKGDLTNAKQDIVSDDAISRLPIAKQIATFLERGGSRPAAEDNETVVAEAFEATIAATSGQRFPHCRRDRPAARPTSLRRATNSPVSSLVSE
jgi:ribonuclease III